jgi:hypothetical protein
MALPNLTNADVVLGSPLLLADYVAKANSGSATTVVSRALKGLDEDDVEGSYICFISGPNAGTDRIITDYESTNDGTFTFDALDNTVDNTTTFALVSLDYSGGVDRAKTIIENDLRKQGYDINNFLTEAHLRELLLLKTLSHICRVKRQDADTDDSYHVSYLEFEEAYNQELTNLVADYDSDEDDTIDENEEGVNLGQPVFIR